MDSYRSTILFLIVLMALSATFSASETALTAANKIRLKNQAEYGDKRAAGALKLAEKYDIPFLDSMTTVQWFGLILYR